MDVCLLCCVLSGRGLCDELITRPEESYRLWCVVVWDLETSWMRRPVPNGGSRNPLPPPKKNIYIFLKHCVMGKVQKLSSFKSSAFHHLSIGDEENNWAPARVSGSEFQAVTSPIICALFKAYSGDRAWKPIGDRLKCPHYLSRVDHERKIRSRKQRTDIGKYSFLNRTLQIWNQLPAEVFENLPCKQNIFKRRVRKALIECN
jgi:hypothetical protein